MNAHTLDQYAIEEANAAIGAAVSTCSLPTEDEKLLIDVQYELLDLADAAVARPDRIRAALRRHRVDELPRGFAVLGGDSDAAGLLKLARAITRRAATSMPSEGAEYLDLLAELLLALAFEAEERERQRLPYGLCVQP